MAAPAPALSGVAWIEHLLSIVVERRADELRVCAGQEPKMFAGGVARPLSIPRMSERDVRELLGDLLSVERQGQAAREGQSTFVYTSKASGHFQVVLAIEPDLHATFTKADPRAASPAASVSSPVAAVPPTAALSAVSPSGIAPPPVALEGQPPDRRHLASLLGRAASLRASDLHLADGEVPRIRVDGRLRPLDGEPLADVTALLGLEPGDRERLGRSGSVDAATGIEGVGRVRVHAYSASTGVAAAIRLLPLAAPPLSALGMPAPLDDLALLPHGLVILCGPSGSGKSTTLASLAQEALRRRSIVMVTLEDPIEYGLQATDSSIVRRRQIGRDVGTFASGLRDALREDPDILLVGEMRDPETISLALTAAETGHLVLASMHSRSAPSAIQRIFDGTAPERQQQIKAQLADSLRAVIAQRLLPRLHHEGRVPVCEVMRGTAAVASVIREGRTAQLGTIIQSGRRDGMVSLERCLADRVHAGDVSLDDARSAANDVSTLTLYMTDG